MLRFSLFKIPVSIHWMFWLLAAFLGGATRAQSPQAWHAVFVFMVAVFVSIMVHELGHALTGIKFGGRGPSIHLHGTGGFAHFDLAQFGRKQQILMTAAGPAASFGLSFLFFLLQAGLIPVLDTQSYPVYLIALFMVNMAWINLVWGIFNLMPALPLDGGRIVAYLLGPARIKTTCIISFATIGVLAVLLWVLTGSLFNLIIMFLLGSHTWTVYKQAKER